MKHIHAFFISLLLFSSQLIFAGEDPLCQYKTALDLCYFASGSVNAGFIAAKAAMETYKNDKEMVLILKEAMCMRLVSKEYHDELIEIAEDVIRESSRPLNIGAAWYQKSRIAYYSGDYKKSLIYADIALNTLEKAEYTADEDKISFREMYECLCHLEKRDSYEMLDDKKKYEAENEILKNYKWYSEN